MRLSAVGLIVTLALAILVAPLAVEAQPPLEFPIHFRHLKNSEPCMIGASEGARAQSTTIGHHSSSGTNALWFARRNRYEPKDHIRCPFTTHICGS
jgi:hypothetical protein